MTGWGSAVGRAVPRVYLVVMAVCFAVPMLVVVRLALRDDPTRPLEIGDVLDHWSASAMSRAATDPQVLEAARTTGVLIVGAVALNLTVLLPVALVTALRYPRLRPVVAALTLVPWIAPPVALVVGVVAATDAGVPWPLGNVYALLPFYALWTMPFTYRVLDSGLQALGARRLYEAGRVLGATRRTVVRRVLLPGLRASVVAAAVLTAATVLGEYAFATMLVQPTLSTVLVGENPDDPRGLMLLALLVASLAGLALLALSSDRARHSAPDVR